MILVYHATNPRWTTERPTRPDEFVLVATVPTDELDAAFLLTNHVESSWTLNPDLEVHVPRARSTSVGDVLRHVHEGIDQLYLVGPVTFEPLQPNFLATTH